MVGDAVALIEITLDTLLSECLAKKSQGITIVMFGGGKSYQYIIENVLSIVAIVIIIISFFFHFI